VIYWPVLDCFSSRAEVKHSRFLDRFYSTYGHVAKLAEEIKKGAASVEGVEVKIWQVSVSNDAIFGFDRRMTLKLSSNTIKFRQFHVHASDS
jgi:hypothetical protein